MKRSILIVLLYIFPYWMYGQQSLLADRNTPVDGMSVSLRLITLPEIKKCDDGKVWNLRNADVSDDGIPVSYNYHTINSSEFLKTTPYGIWHYTFIGDSICETGSETRLNNLHYTRPIVDMSFPLSQGDTLSGYFLAKGRYCEELPYLTFGHYKTQILECGTVIIPEGDTIQNVICVEQSLVSTNKWIACFDSLKNYKHTTDDSIAYQLAKASFLRNEVKCRWYSENSCFPFLETIETEIMQNRHTTKLQNIAYYCSFYEFGASEQPNFPSMPFLCQSHRCCPTDKNCEHNAAHVNVSYIENKRVIVEIIGDTRDKKEYHPYMVSSSDGKMILSGRVQTGNPGGNLIDLSSLQNGVYLLSCLVHGEWLTEKVVTKQ